jgi:hypothetical protein
MMAGRLLGDTPIEPGEKRRLGFVFLSGEEAADIVRNAGTFYLWEGRFIGEARVISSRDEQTRMVKLP